MTEITLKPDWDNAPEWARWWAVDQSGQCYWYQKKPYLSERETYWDYPDFDCEAELDIVDGWKESLQERPIKITEKKPWTPPLTAEEHRDFMTASIETKLDRIIELLEIGQVVYVDSTQRIENNLAKLMPVPPGINPPEM